MSTPVVKRFRLDNVRLLVPKDVGGLEQRERWSSPKISKLLEDDTTPGQAGTREEFPSPAQRAEGALKRPDLEHGDNRRPKEGDDEKSHDGGPEAQDQSADARRRRAQAEEIDKGYEEKLERFDRSVQALRQEDQQQSTPLPLDAMVLQRATDPPLMRRFHFHLRARGMIHRDIDGTELPDVTSARAHAAAVADKLMRHCGAPTRQWSMFVEDDAGKSQFDLAFVDVDASIAPDSPQMRLLFPGACSSTAVGETCRRLGEPVDSEQSMASVAESVVLAAATQNPVPRPLDGIRLERSIPSSDFVPPERGTNRLGAILPIGIACAVVAPIAYYLAVGNPFSSGSNKSPLRPELQHANGPAAVWEPISGVSQSESAKDKKLANAEPPNAVSEKREQAGLPDPVPTAIERPAEPAAPAQTRRAVPLTPALASVPASSPEQQPAGQLSDPLPTAIDHPAELAAAQTRRASALASGPASAPEQQLAGQLSDPVPMAIDHPAELAPTQTRGAVSLTPAFASVPAAAPVAPQSAPAHTMAMRAGGMNPDEIQLLLKQGQEFAAVGDLATARTVLRRAAEAGDVAAALALAQCYDPNVLTQMRARGVAPDIGEARRWYEIARQFGSIEAARHLAFLPPE